MIKRHLELVFAHELRSMSRQKPAPVPAREPIAPPAPTPSPEPDPSREDSPPPVYNPPLC
jgi:hypothetical protein